MFVHCFVVTVHFMFAVFTISAEVIIAGHQAVGSLLFPAGLRAAVIRGAVHAMRASIQLPAGVELKVVAYCRYVQAIICQSSNELQSFQVVVGIESPATSPSGVNHSMLFPHPDGFRMNVQHFCDNPYRINR